jgi:hypothetical protein
LSFVGGIASLGAMEGEHNGPSTPFHIDGRKRFEERWPMSGYVLSLPAAKPGDDRGPQFLSPRRQFVLPRSEDCEGFPSGKAARALHNVIGLDRRKMRCGSSDLEIRGKWSWKNPRPPQ